MREPIDERLLWKYLDGQCTPTEKSSIDSRLKEDELVKQQLDEMTAMHEALIMSNKPAFEIDLTDQVLAQLPSKSIVERYSGINYRPFFIFLSIIGLSLFVPVRKSDLLVFDWKPFLDVPISIALPEMMTFDFPDFGTSAYYIAFAMIAIPLLYFLDKFLQKQKIGNIPVLIA